MKLVYYLPSLEAPGGLERIITFKANYFAEHFEGYEVIIVTSEQREQPPHFPLSKKVKHIDINVLFDVPYTQSRISKLLKYPFRYYRFKKRFTQLLYKLRPDITISTMRRELNFINKINDGSIKIGEFHTARHAYGAEPIESKNPFVGYLKKRWSERFVTNLSQLKRVVILTHEGAGDWPELHNLTVISNPISTPKKEKCADSASQQVISVGRYIHSKGFDMLITAWKMVSVKHPDWVLKIYGEGNLKGKLQRQIDETHLTETCLLEHTVSDIANKYCESSIFVLSSRYEGQPLVLGEAMSYGVVPVAFSCPCGPRDMITDGTDGLLVESGNTKQLADKICYLIEHEQVRQEMGKQASQRAKAFEMESIGQLWKKMFEEVIKTE